MLCFHAYRMGMIEYNFHRTKKDNQLITQILPTFEEELRLLFQQITHNIFNTHIDIRGTDQSRNIDIKQQTQKQSLKRQRQQPR